MSIYMTRQYKQREMNVYASITYTIFFSFLFVLLLFFSSLDQLIVSQFLFSYCVSLLFEKNKIKKDCMCICLHLGTRWYYETDNQQEKPKRE